MIGNNIIVYSTRVKIYVNSPAQSLPFNKRISVVLHISSKDLSNKFIVVSLALLDLLKFELSYHSIYGML